MLICYNNSALNSSVAQMLFLRRHLKETPRYVSSHEISDRGRFRGRCDVCEAKYA